MITDLKLSVQWKNKISASIKDEYFDFLSKKIRLEIKITMMLVVKRQRKQSQRIGFYDWK